MSSGEDIDSIVRRMIAKDLECNIESVVDEFDWLSQTSREDAGWFLAAIQGRFNSDHIPEFYKRGLTPRNCNHSWFDCLRAPEIG